LRFYVPLDIKWVISKTFFPANLLVSTEETKPKTAKANISSETKKIQHKIKKKQNKKLKPGFVALYDLRPGNRASRPYSTIPGAHTRPECTEV